MPLLEITVEGLLANLTPENAAALSGGPLDGGQVWYEFLTQEDDRVRPSHRALHGTVWHAGDPAAPMPPLDYGCRCFIRYVAAPGTEAAKLLPPAPSEPTTQEVAFGRFLDAEAAGWRAALAALQDKPAGDVLPGMATYFVGQGMSSAQAKDAARMAVAAVQPTRAEPGPIPPTPPVAPPAPGSAAVGQVPASGGAIPAAPALAPLPPLQARAGPTRQTVAPTADQAADQAKAKALADAQAAVAAAKAKKAARLQAQVDAASKKAMADADAAAAKAKSLADYQAKEAAHKAAVDAELAKKAAAQKAMDDKFAADVAKAQAKIDAEKLAIAKQVKDVEAALAAEALKKSNTIAALTTAQTTGPKKVLSPEQKAINNLKSKERRAKKKAALQAGADQPAPVGIKPPDSTAKEVAAKVVYDDFLPASAPASKTPKLTSEIPFGYAAPKLADMRAAQNLDAMKPLMPRFQFNRLAQNGSTERDAAAHNQQASAAMHATDATTVRPVERFTHGHDRYMRAIDRGDTDAEVLADMLRGAKMGAGPVAYAKNQPNLRELAVAKIEELKQDVAKMNEMFTEAAYARRVPVLFRGMHSLTDKQMEAIIRGDTFKFGAMSSASTRGDVGHSFASHGGGNQVVFRMRNPRGLPIKARSKYNGEDEVLLHRDEKFKIVGVMRDQGGYFIVDMEAIQ